MNSISECDVSKAVECEARRKARTCEGDFSQTVTWLSHEPVTSLHTSDPGTAGAQLDRINSHV